MRVEREYRLTSVQRNALIGVLALIGSLAAYNWALRPHVSSLRAAQRYEWATGERLNVGESINEDLVAQREKLEALCVERAAFSEMAFCPAEAMRFYNDLQALCREAACTVTLLSYGDDESVAGYGAEGTVSAMIVRSVSLTIHGSYGSVMRFLGTLQSRPEKVWVDSFEMATVPSKPDRVVCDITITICVDQEKGCADRDQASHEVSLLSTHCAEEMEAEGASASLGGRMPR